MFLATRLKDHITDTSNLHLKNAIKAYGLDQFVFSVVSWFEPHSELTMEENRDLLLALSSAKI